MDEINIVDTGSTDKTIEIEKGYANRIYHFDWIDDFSAARNFSFSKATKEYVLWLDADDILIPENRLKFMQSKQGLSPRERLLKCEKTMYGNMWSYSIILL